MNQQKSESMWNYDNFIDRKAENCEKNSVYNVAGTLAAGVLTTPRNVATALPISCVVLEVPQVNRVSSERSPLIIRRRRVTRSQGQNAIFNWKILCLLIILVAGVFIGIHLLIIECEKIHFLLKLCLQCFNGFFY